MSGVGWPCRGIDEEGADRFNALQSNHCRWASRECREVEKWSVGDGKELGSGELDLQDIITLYTIFYNNTRRLFLAQSFIAGIRRVTVDERCK